MVQVEVKKEIVLTVDNKDIHLTEEQAKKLLDSLKVILEPPTVTLTVSEPTKEYIPIPIYPMYPYPNYPWITYTTGSTINNEIYHLSLT
jgi:hypothetical protein